MEQSLKETGNSTNLTSKDGGLYGLLNKVIIAAAGTMSISLLMIQKIKGSLIKG